MPQLPHIKNNFVAQDVAEAVTLNRFNMLITPPVGVETVGHLSDEIKTVGGLDQLDKLPEIVKQISRGHTRNYVSAFVDDQSLEITLTINLNAHGEKANDVVIYRMFKQWARLQRNEKDGSQALKRDYIGNFILEQHGATGDVWRKVTAERVIIQEMSGLDEASLEAGEPVEFSVTLVVEEFTPEIFGMD